MLGRVRRLYSFHFRDERRERLFLTSLGFAVTVAIVRVVTLMIREGVGPVHNVTAGGLHIHHLVWGILLLLAVGFVWMLEVGVGSSWVASLTAIAFGVGAALALDEFALWLNLSDVYWQRQGRESLEALAIFAGVCAAGLFGWPFVRDVALVVTRHKPYASGAYE
ncbi:MAG TPA: hypothetical protein VKE27_09690 [Candidatus Dormibacteraeota bacterium]|nr:hypothetical protein [Candidatus Dormibacteraeota bacterium]